MNMPRDEEPAERVTRRVFEAHLANADQGEVEKDIAENFAPDCVLLTGYGRFEGHAGVRAAAELLAKQLPDATFRYLRKDVAGRVAFLEWAGEGRNAAVLDGADSFLIEDGRIRVMTIHYTIEPVPAGTR